MSTEKAIINWLLEGDISIQHQVYRDLFNENRPDLQKRISTEGWGKQYLSLRRPDGHWGLKFYQPKWISTHYTLLDLRNLCISPKHPDIHQTIDLIFEHEKCTDGGINPPGSVKVSDVCINGMFLNYACYFQAAAKQLESVIDYILAQIMIDGGFNCQHNRRKVRHSSLHSTLSVLEGLYEYLINGYTYRIDEVKTAIADAKEFILKHQLYLSDRTGEIIHKNLLKLTYPDRWYFNILRALDFFRYSKTAWDERMQPAMDVLLKKRTKDRVWKLQARHPGQEHFPMEQVGKPSRWNTLRALRVIKYYM